LTPPESVAAPRRASGAAREDGRERAARAPRLSYRQLRRLEELPGEIERLEAEIARLEGLLADPGLYAADPEKFTRASEALAARKARLEAAEEEWLELEALREEIGG